MVNPMILRQVRAFALAVSPSEPHPSLAAATARAVSFKGGLRPYRASAGKVGSPPASAVAIRNVRFTSTPAVRGVGAKRQIYPAMASADFVLSLRQQLVRIDADGASDGDVFRRVMAGIEQGPHASLDPPWLRSIRSEGPARTLSGGQRMRRPENENNVGQANGGDRRHDRHPV
jgi:hypothetical protein